MSLRGAGFAEGPERQTQSRWKAWARAQRAELVGGRLPGRQRGAAWLEILYGLMIITVPSQ